MLRDDSLRRAGGLITDIAATLVACLAVWLLAVGASHLHGQGSMMTGGSIQAVEFVHARPCCTFHLTVSTRNNDGRPSTIHAVVINADTGLQTSRVEDTTYVPAGGQHEGVATDHVAIDRPGIYVVRFILVLPNGVEIGQADSPRFTVS